MIVARAASEGDGPAVSALRQANRAATSQEKGGDRYVSEVPDPAGADVVVGCIGEVVVGYGTLRVEGEAGVVDELYVEPPARGVGVGHALVGELATVATARGCRWLDSVALPGDRGTKNFFEAHGMVTRLLRVSRPLT